MAVRQERIQIRKNLFNHVRRAVVKVGSGVLTHDQDLNTKVIRRLAREISMLMDQGRQVILVSSGAIASGMKKVGMAERPSDIPHKQAVAAIGQSRLMLEYEKSFGRYEKKVAQILLTRDDLCNRRRYLNARNTLHVLLDWKILPIVNENDTVVVDELKFGDNDNLSAMMTHLMDAQVLINLTDIDGLYDKDPRVHKDALLIPLVSNIDRAMEKAARDIPGALGTGGMSSKIQAAKKVTTSGIPMVIANGLKPNILKSLFEGRDVGTLFLQRREKMRSRKSWIAFTLKARGTIKVDRGAAKAICEQGRSLLPIGILDVEGDFGVGAPVICIDPNGAPFARGIVNYKASDIRKLMGLKTSQIEQRLGYKHYDEVIHRNNLVLTVDDKEGPVCQ
ncbi:MAG: glutamate 5-kinase [Deltaproteobacteria bacterium]|nr:glutamate 5-kinase [Deltaproteobacteria bacterium]MBW2018744.1 glutamate 5-kinase [Deltaproteobacteria bacterium]MBW2073473.1 glutamate 5-kinase [Deltaproteobacteria bacterium]RLB83021.1 MAG: glutamate 5-kinase [Deltaproteobacteria bacterium]